MGSRARNSRTTPDGGAAGTGARSELERLGTDSPGGAGLPTPDLSPIVHHGASERPRIVMDRLTHPMVASVEERRGRTVQSVSTIEAAP